MLRRWLEVTALVMGLCCFSGAQAGLITDVVEVDRYVPYYGSASWTHDLNDEGFSLGSAISGTLSIEFMDDHDRAFCIYQYCFEAGETARIVIGTVDFLDDVFSYVPHSDFSQLLGINSIASLNSTGMLDVWVGSRFPHYGDFLIGDSILEVVTTDIPEPGPLALYGIGLLGLGLTRLRAKLH